MKIIVSLFVAIAVVGCGSSNGGAADAGACAESVLVGTWVNTAIPNTYTFNSNCQGTGSYCASTFTYPPVTATSGTALATMTSSNLNAGCTGTGTLSCIYVITAGSSMTFNCGSGTYTYTKQ